MLGDPDIPDILKTVAGSSQTWGPPDVGLAPTGVWRVPPHPPLQLEDPSLKPKPFPPRLLLPSSPPSPLALFAMFRDGAAQSGVGGGGVPGCRGGGGWRRGPSSSTWGQTHIWGYSTNGGLSPKFSEKIGRKNPFQENRAFSGLIGAFFQALFGADGESDSSAPHSRGEAAAIPPKGPFGAQLAPFGLSPPFAKPPYGFPQLWHLGNESAPWNRGGI